jgi:hypothetical protein
LEGLSKTKYESIMKNGESLILGDLNQHMEKVGMSGWLWRRHEYISTLTAASHNNKKSLDAR